MNQIINYINQSNLNNQIIKDNIDNKILEQILSDILSNKLIEYNLQTPHGVLLPYYRNNLHQSCIKFIKN